MNCAKIMQLFFKILTLFIQRKRCNLNYQSILRYCPTLSATGSVIHKFPPERILGFSTRRIYQPIFAHLQMFESVYLEVRFSIWKDVNQMAQDLTPWLFASVAAAHDTKCPFNFTMYGFFVSESIWKILRDHFSTSTSHLQSTSYLL